MIAAVVLEKSEHALEEVLEVLETISPSLEIGGCYTIFFDGADDAGRAFSLLQQKGLAVRGVADAETAFVAQVATAKGELHRITGGQAFLAPLSIVFLPVSTEIHRRLFLLGLKTMGELTRIKKRVDLSVW
jgi:hypothetical protein